MSTWTPRIVRKDASFKPVMTPRKQSESDMIREIHRDAIVILGSIVVCLALILGTVLVSMISGGP